MDLGADFAGISSFDLIQRSNGGFLGINDIVIAAAAVPEPASAVLLGSGLLAFAGLRRRRQT